jgi:hypothetical protein
LGVAQIRRKEHDLTQVDLADDGASRIGVREIRARAGAAVLPWRARPAVEPFASLERSVSLEQVPELVLQPIQISLPAAKLVLLLVNISSSGQGFAGYSALYACT